MSFKYINLGYADFLDSKEDNTTIYSQVYNSEHGVSIQGTSTKNRSGYYHIDATKNAEVYCKADFFLNRDYSYSESYSGIFWEGSNSFCGLGIYGYSWVRFYILYNTQSYNYWTFDYIDRILQGTLYVHFKCLSESNEVVIDVCIFIANKQYTMTRTISITDFDYSKLYISPKLGYFSNIIISDEPIFPTEKIIKLPIKSTETTMQTDGNGNYFPDAAGQTLLQSVDTDALINTYGDNLSILGIANIGNPAFKSNGDVSSLTAISKSGGIITEYGSCALPNSALGVIADEHKADLTIADLANIQFGWRS